MYHRRRYRRGANAVEFALTLPLIVIILSGVIDLSYYLHLQYSMINAVSQGARAGATTPVPVETGDPVPKDVAKTVTEDVWTESGLPGFPAVVAVTSGVDPNIQITVSGELAYVGFIGYVPTPDKLQHTTVMRLDDQS